MGALTPHPAPKHGEKKDYHCENTSEIQAEIQLPKKMI